MAADAELEAFMNTVCQVDSTGHVAVGETMAAPTREGDPILELLGELSEPRAREAFHAQLRVHDTLGEGGMGLVRLAHQRTMGREVAVKTTRPDRTTPEAMALLLREAWVTARLEHPNIVPVYGIGADDGGRPMVVLKRITGVEWDDLVGDHHAIAHRFGDDDPLEWNIGILLQVMNAVRFAHSRGIVHRDLKPQNVMIGEFGEVYVLDWGIAVSTRPDETGRMIAAGDVSQPTGTPGYMAPEMLGGAPITEATDIYLLGAVLYEIATGSVLHNHGTIDALIDSIRHSQADIPEGVPDELAGIIRTATARTPSERFPSVDAMQVALREFLEHRSSERLRAVADERLDALREYIAEADRESPEADPARVHAAFTECRFGYREALQSWPDNEQARAQLREAQLAMVEYELATSPRNASTLLAQVDNPPDSLATRVASALEAAETQNRRLARLSRQHDQNIGWRTRTLVFAILGVFWFGIPLVTHFLDPSILVGSFRRATEVTVGVFGLIAGLVVWARESLLKTSLNRRLTLFALISLPLQLIGLVGAMSSGLTIREATPIALFLWMVLAAAMAASTSAFLIPVVINYAAAYLVAAYNPDLTVLCYAWGNFGLFINVGWYSLRVRDEDDRSIRRRRA